MGFHIPSHSFESLVVCALLTWRNARTRNTFKAKKTVQEGSKASQLKRYATAVLGSGNLKQAVVLPEGEDLNEWLAVNSITLHTPPTTASPCDPAFVV
jgi:hypothetical protein